MHSSDSYPSSDDSGSSDDPPSELVKGSAQFFITTSGRLCIRFGLGPATPEKEFDVLEQDGRFKWSDKPAKERPSGILTYKSFKSEKKGEKGY